ncbi:MAG: hypothetical protein JW908_00475 [Anaerolineales bacterium]|nr:hypothetical protein [Anaerolineales bacterium]
MNIHLKSTAQIKPVNKAKAMRLVMSAVEIARRAGIDIRIAPINDDEQSRPRIAVIIADVVLNGNVIICKEYSEKEQSAGRSG